MGRSGGQPRRSTIGETGLDCFNHAVHAKSIGQSLTSQPGITFRPSGRVLKVMPSCLKGSSPIAKDSVGINLAGNREINGGRNLIGSGGENIGQSPGGTGSLFARHLAIKPIGVLGLPDPQGTAATTGKFNPACSGDPGGVGDVPQFANAYHISVSDNQGGGGCPGICRGIVHPVGGPHIISIGRSDRTVLGWPTVFAAEATAVESGLVGRATRSVNLEFELLIQRPGVALRAGRTKSGRVTPKRPAAQHPLVAGRPVF